jgi:hypothetical protein
MPATYPVIDETHEITEASALRPQRTKNNVINYYRNLYARSMGILPAKFLCFVSLPSSHLFLFWLIMLSKLDNQKRFVNQKVKPTITSPENQLYAFLRLHGRAEGEGSASHILLFG